MGDGVLVYFGYPQAHAQGSTVSSTMDYLPPSP
jgi:hypothetical protein